MLGFIFRLFRYAVVALLRRRPDLAKFVLQSHATEDTEEIDLVNIFGGSKLISAADPFFGGK